MTEHGRRCSRCSTLYPLHLIASAFQANRRRGEDASSPRRKLVCRPCEQTGRDTRKRGDRWKSKARDVIRRHAIRLEVTKEYLTDVCGWTVDRLAHDAKHQYGNGCNYCGHQYQEMGHGLADITLDVMDRSKDPYYRTNTKWCCQTCNRKKGAMTPEAFECDRQVYETWTRQRDASPEERGLLFDLSNA